MTQGYLSRGKIRHRTGTRVFTSYQNHSVRDSFSPVNRFESVYVEAQGSEQRANAFCSGFLHNLTRVRRAKSRRQDHFDGEGALLKETLSAQRYFTASRGRPPTDCPMQTDLEAETPW